MLAASAVLLWWRRRPAGSIGAPTAHPGSRYPALVIGILVLMGLLLPLLGATMVTLLLLERFVLGRFPAARQFLGLASER